MRRAEGPSWAPRSTRPVTDGPQGPSIKCEKQDGTKLSALLQSALRLPRLPRRLATQANR
eukprot:1088486-Pyramimonas_sp.AAC.1